MPSSTSCMTRVLGPELGDRADLEDRVGGRLDPGRLAEQPGRAVDDLAVRRARPTAAPGTSYFSSSGGQLLVDPGLDVAEVAHAAHARSRPSAGVRPIRQGCRRLPVVVGRTVPLVTDLACDGWTPTRPPAPPRCACGRARSTATRCCPGSPRSSARSASTTSSTSSAPGTTSLVVIGVAGDAWQVERVAAKINRLIGVLEVVIDAPA